MILFSSPPTQDLHPNLQSKEKPKVVRRRKKRTRDSLGMEAKKRRLTEEQVKFLELSFWKERKLESERKAYLATELGIEPKQVAVWFQNRRARSKNKQLEEEYSKLKNLHDLTVVQKCHLEAEVLHLKEKLLEAEKEIRKLSGGLGGEIGSSTSSSTTSLSIDNNQQFVRGEEELMYFDGYNNTSIFEWLD